MPPSNLSFLRPPGTSVASLRQLLTTSSSPSSTPFVFPLSLASRRRPGTALILIPIAAPTSQQCRSKTRSTSSSPNNASGAGKSPPPPRPPLLRTILRAILSDLRRLAYSFRTTSLRSLFRQSPAETVVAVICIILSVACGVYIVQIYRSYFYSDEFTRYPPEVAKLLRRALYFSNYKPDPPRALKNYKLALERCNELGLDPFSDDVLGIRIQLAAWLEKIENYRNSIRVLEELLADCRRWIDVMEKHAKEGTLPAAAAGVNAAAVAGATVSSDPTSPAVPAEAAAGAAPKAETLWGKRTRLLAKAVSISVKLANLYSDEHVREQEQAHERLVWAVETALGEMQRRSKEKPHEGEEDWIGPEQVGGSLEALAGSYFAKEQFHLALPLFFQALRLCQEPCHMAVLMNNIAASFAEHPLMAPGAAPVDSLMMQADTSAGAKASAADAWNLPEERKKRYLQAARNWAMNANRHATEPKGEARTGECGAALVTSLVNLGEIDLREGNSAAATHKFEKAAELAKKIGFDEGIVKAQGSLKGR